MSMHDKYFLSIEVIHSLLLKDNVNLSSFLKCWTVFLPHWAEIILTCNREMKYAFPNIENFK